MTPEERAREIGVPLIPKIPRNPNPTYPVGPIAVCGECGRDVYQVECYSCPHMNCPIQMKSTC